MKAEKTCRTVWNSKGLEPRSKGPAWAPLFLFALAPLRILVDQNPTNLNPRSALDAASQRVNALLFRGLTRKDADLTAVPDLAERWQTSHDGRRWTFLIKRGLTDHRAEPITPEKIAVCLENYRIGKPASAHRTALPHWVGTKSTKTEVILELDAPDPYLATNISLMRYYRVPGKTPEAGDGICTEIPAGIAPIGSGLFEAENWDPSPETELRLKPADQRRNDRPLHFYFIRDENTRALKILRGEVDVAQSCLSLAKTRWFQSRHNDRFDVLERQGVNVSYLAFNLRDPLLKRLEVRKAISLALEIGPFVQYKMFGFGSPAGSFLSPLLPESFSTPVSYDLVQAERLLDHAGLKKGDDGVRLRLRYKTTPVREGLETAQIFKKMLAKVGIEITVDVVEPAVFLASIRQRQFQLYSSRWVGVSDASILYTTLRAGQPRNSVGYDNPEVNQLLDQMMRESIFEKRRSLARQVQAKMAQDLPYLPLWFWHNAAILKKGTTGLKAEELSLSASFEPLIYLRDAIK